MVQLPVILIFPHRTNFYRFWDSPFWFAFELLMAAVALWAGRWWSYVIAASFSADILYRNEVVINDAGVPMWGATLQRWQEMASILEFHDIPYLMQVCSVLVIFFCALYCLWHRWYNKGQVL